MALIDPLVDALIRRAFRNPPTALGCLPAAWFQRAGRMRHGRGVLASDGAKLPPSESPRH